MAIAKQRVVAALTALYVGRARAAGYRYVRNVLRTHGNGANSIGELDPSHYESVFAAAGGVLSTNEKFPVRARSSAPAEPPRRIRSPLTLDLERRIAERAGKPRSKPTGRVDTGNRSQPGDRRDDIDRGDYPTDGVKMT